MLLIFYAAGLGVPFLIAGAAVGRFTRFAHGLGSRLAVLETVGGLVLVAMGVLLVTDTFTRLNEYTARFGIGAV